MLKIIPNPDKEIFDKVSALVKKNDNYCPCAIFKVPETVCPCLEFRNQNHKGECHCKRFVKVEI